MAMRSEGIEDEQQQEKNITRGHTRLKEFLFKMANAKLTYFFVIFQAAFVDNKFVHQKSSLFTRLAVIRVLQSNNSQTFAMNEEFRPILSIDTDSNHRCKYKAASGNSSRNGGENLFPGFFSARYNHHVSDSNQVKAEPTSNGESNEFRLARKKDEEDEDEDEDEDEGNELPDIENAGTNDWDDDAENEKDEVDFPDGEKKTKKNKNQDDDDESDYEDEDIPQLKHIKHFFKHKVKVKDLMFFLLLVYKVKLVTLIPLLLGAKILLVGATTMAGFFFALFAAAIGLQTKSNHH